jgi:hypothetical protein
MALTITNTSKPRKELHDLHLAGEGHGDQDQDPYKIHHVKTGELTASSSSDVNDNDPHEEGWEIAAPRTSVPKEVVHHQNDTRNNEKVVYENAAMSARRRLKHMSLISLLVVVLTVAGTIFYVFYTGNNVNIPQTEFTVQDILDAFLEDPWDYGPGSAQEQINWSPSSMRDGLNLRVINALTPDWHQYYEDSMADWENGAPDALTLRSEMAAQPDPACEAIRGTMKVCNNDYGENGWKGLNEVLVTSQGIIVVSVAKMNEWYLASRNSNSAERRYTMCHELGHGFGLNHVDENFRNRDLGTCMDYTVRPQNNLLPNTDNYETLAMLYGIVPNGTATGLGTTGMDTNTMSGGQQQQQQGNTNTEKQEKENKNKDDRRILRLRRAAQSTAQAHHHIPMDFPSFTDHGDRHHWRLLKVHKGGEVHERVLEGGHRVIAHLLLAN